MIINEGLYGKAVKVETSVKKDTIMIFQGLCETKNAYTAALCEDQDGKLRIVSLDVITFLDAEDVQKEIMRYTMVKIPEECFNSNLINREGISDKDANEVKIVRTERICSGYKDYGIDGTIAEYDFVAFDEDNNPYRCGELYWEDKKDET